MPSSKSTSRSTAATPTAVVPSSNPSSTSSSTTGASLPTTHHPYSHAAPPIPPLSTPLPSPLSAPLASPHAMSPTAYQHFTPPSAPASSNTALADERNNSLKRKPLPPISHLTTNATTGATVSLNFLPSTSS